MIHKGNGHHLRKYITHILETVNTTLSSVGTVKLIHVVHVPYLPVYKSIPCISQPSIFDGKKSNFLISLLNVHGILILYSLISGTVNCSLKWLKST